MRTLGSSPYEQAEEAMFMPLVWFNGLIKFLFEIFFLLIKIAIFLLKFLIKLPYRIYTAYKNWDYRRKHPEMFQGFEPVIPEVPPLED